MIANSEVIEHSKFFDDHDRPLRDVLLDRFIIPAARFVAGEDSSDTFLAKAAGSYWECALAAMAALRLLSDLAPRDDALRQSIARKIVGTTSWLVEGASKSPAGWNWDGVLWDTAVCTRALAMISNSYLGGVDSLERPSAVGASEGLRWLQRDSQNLSTERLVYAGGPGDFGQLLLTLGYFAEHSRSLAESALGHDGVENLRITADRVASHILDVHEELEFPTPSGDVETVTTWGDAFQTADVLEALTEYVRVFAMSSRSDLHLQLIRESEDAIVRTTRFFETQQSDGRWGAYLDTCRSLQAYVHATRRLPHGNSEHHLVMKSLRWMCDEKQRFSDGSFMHSTMISVFMLGALLEARENWRLAERPVSQAYDEALWYSGVTSTPERARRLALEVERRDLVARTQRSELEVSAYLAEASFRSRAERRGRIARASLALVIAATVLAFASGLVSLTLGISSLALSVPQGGWLLSYVGVVAGLLYALPRIFPDAAPKRLPSALVSETQPRPNAAPPSQPAPRPRGRRLERLRDLIAGRGSAGSAESSCAKCGHRKADHSLRHAARAYIYVCWSCEREGLNDALHPFELADDSHASNVSSDVPPDLK